MINKLLIILVLVIFSSCTKDILRKEFSATVYYNNLPVKGAKVLVWNGYEKGFEVETETDTSGFFLLPEINRYSLGLKPHNLSQKFLILQKNLSSDTLFTQSKRNNNANDTIYLKIVK